MKHRAFFVGVAVLLTAVAWSSAASPAQRSNVSSSVIEPQGSEVHQGVIQTYHNPIVDYVSADPQAMYFRGFYYLVLSSNIWPYVQGGIILYKSRILTDFRPTENSLIYGIPPGLANLWAPEIHEVDGEVYIYFAMDDGDNNNHRMYVIKANNPADLLYGGWSPEKRLYTTDAIDHWAIDGTLLKYPGGRLYMVWSGWPAPNVGSPQNLYIAPMSDPMTISGPRVLLREPKFDWEGPFCLEGPYALQRGIRTFIVFSAESTWGPDYCLGMMGIDGFQDPLIPGNWWNNNEGCVFYRNDAENVFCTGHAAFTTSPDGVETWVVFHATSDVNDPGQERVARVEKLEFDDNDYPIFPRPSGDSRALAVPSGRVQETYVNPVIDILSADPSAIYLNGFYYLIISTNEERELRIYKSPWLTDFRGAQSTVIYNQLETPGGFTNAWASEMHFIDGELFCYFAQNRPGEEHHMYVIKAEDANNPVGKWGPPIRMMPDLESFAIDGSILRYDGRLYFVFCSVDVGVDMSIYIAPMSDPYTVSGPRVLLKSPKAEWESHGFPVNEGPFIVQNNGRTFLIYSASSTWTPDYCLGMIGIESGKNPLLRSDWWDDLNECQLYRNDEEGIYCTGHAAFLKSPDGTELWVMYHATDDPNSNEQSTRMARVDRVKWAEDHAPSFLRPTNQPRAVPSGQQPRTQYEL